jgi:hypothetical protein
MDIERWPDSIACEQSESPLVTFLGQFLLYLFPAVIFAGVSQINSASIYLESSPSHLTPLSNRWFSIGSRRLSTKFYCSAAGADKMSG